MTFYERFGDLLLNFPKSYYNGQIVPSIFRLKVALALSEYF